MHDSQSLGAYLARLQDLFPRGLVCVNREVSPEFEVSAVLEHLERKGRFPAALFTNVCNLQGEPGHKVAINLMADRRSIAVALGMSPGDVGISLTQEVSRRASNPLDFQVVDPAEAPVREVVLRGDDVDLGRYPILRFHELDGGHYFTVPVAA
ncbi:MAG: UbiD family decarboxylase, partial [Firmicutes bacterium]|nr:UbiD family decarboxylase [Bacillota bacterium]